ncbi:hypothetical protein CH330_03180 [candidate division WOR-3 bacterium JGI_Cruoil_03_51_56]|uniref:Uncharacterized protein n=1 Tax=candidate division WOR-3 bacterium JGI_Cruoil_03_51_56 TaxID=1973747 RepID=A0A235BVA5_UNCW3|nr:MAG: hypothetical protein CH330_03180 [candidate division WOR-3 bacterium JGI_Cruoil_03_51_56]
MKIRITVLCPVAIAVMLIPGCTQKKGPAYERWGITKTVVDNASEKQLASAYDLLYSMKLEQAKIAYRKVAKKFPNSAEAHLGLSIAYRYLHRLPKAVTENQRALELDSNAVAVQCNYADLLTPHRGAKLKEALNDSARYVLSNSYYLKAANSGHPISAYAHIGLWTNYMILGQLDKARQELLALGKENYFPKLLSDFAHNMLISLAPQAIIFTNGDNDTYPLFVLQEYDGFRQDVSVVNISLLNIPTVAGLFRDSLKVPISYSDSELKAMKPEFDSTRGKLVLPSDHLVANIIQNARKKKQPVYFATTVAQNRLSSYKDNLILAGLAWEVTNTKTRDSVNIDKVIQNMTEKYRLDTTGLKQTWPANISPLTRNVSGLAVNYLGLYDLMANYYKGQNKKDKAIDCYRKMVQITVPLGRNDLTETILDRWLKLKPVDSEAKHLKEKYIRS